MSLDADNLDVRGFAAVINSRLATEARIAQALGFAWICGGGAVALCLAGLGVAVALLGYSSTFSVTSAANEVAQALAGALERAELKTSVSGVMSLSSDLELKLAPGQTVRLESGSTVKLDPNSSVRLAGDLKMPQPSKHQLQTETTSTSKELPFTTYTIFRSVNLGQGAVETAWFYDLSDTVRPQMQHCYYRQSLDDGLAGKVTVAVNGSPRRPSSLVKLPFIFDDAVGKCIWFSGY